MSSEQKRAFFAEVEAEADEIQAEFKAHEQANRYMAGSDAAMAGLPAPAGGQSGGLRPFGFGVSLAGRGDARALRDANRT
jgi:hypothetical protein